MFSLLRTFFSHLLNILPHSAVAGMCNIESVWELLLFPEVPLLFHPLVGVVTDQAPLLECLYARTNARNAVAKLVVV